MWSEKLDRDKLEKLLLTNDLFADTFNIFLALPVFGVRIFYNKLARTFEEHEAIVRSGKLATIFDPNMDYIENGANSEHPDGKSSFLKVLNPANTLDMIENHRLQLFSKSEPYFQYVLAKELSIKSPDKIMMTRVEVVEFIKHLKGSVGFNIYNCWMDLTRALNNVMNMQLNRYFIGYLRRIYFSPTSVERIPSVCLGSYKRVELGVMGRLLREELFDQLLDYWKTRFSTHVDYVKAKRGTFVTQRCSSTVALELLTTTSDVMVRVPLQWKRYKLPSRYSNSHDTSALLGDKREILLRTISLEKKSGGFLWESLQQNQHSLGIQRCLILLYFVQLWLEFSVPAIVEKKKTLELTDYIYFSSVHITGDQWIGCPATVRAAVCNLLKYKTGNLNTFKPAVDFSLTYLLKPFVAEFVRNVDIVSEEIRVDGELDLREQLTEAAANETIVMKLSPPKQRIDRACRSREILSVTDVSRRGILHILDREDWLSEIICRRFVI